jgi:hypothetical protein
VHFLRSDKPATADRRLMVKAEIIEGGVVNERAPLALRCGGEPSLVDVEHCRKFAMLAHGLEDGQIGERNGRRVFRCNRCSRTQRPGDRACGPLEPCRGPINRINPDGLALAWTFILACHLVPISDSPGRSLRKRCLAFASHVSSTHLALPNTTWSNRSHAEESG